MRILIVDDENSKVVEICEVLSRSNVSQDDIEVTTTGAAALQALKREYFDLLIVDMYLPSRIGEQPSLSGGIDLLKKINRTDAIKLPEYIMGLTSNAEAMALSLDDFGTSSWFLEEVGPSKSGWKLKLMERVRYLRAREEISSNPKSSKPTSTERPRCDIVFVCALLEPELKELHAASKANWEILTLPGDPAIYWSATLEISGRKISAISLCLPQMGLVAAGVAVAKALATFKPSVVAMSGICAGRKGDCELGDVIGANLTWDYGSGKFTESNDGVVFEPAPFQAAASARVVGILTELATSGTLLQKFYKDSPGYRPPEVPTFHVGPLASGAAVQNHKEFFSGVASQQRKILGVDMEAFAVAWAAHEATEPQPHWLIVKSVVDFADGTKDSRDSVVRLVLKCPDSTLRY